MSAPAGARSPSAPDNDHVRAAVIAPERPAPELPLPAPDEPAPGELPVEVAEPSPAPVPPAPEPDLAAQPGSIPGRLPGRRLRLYVWQLPVRVSHWVTAGCIVVLSLTGGYIADPFLIPPGEQVMTVVRLIHMLAAYTLIVSGIIRISSLILGNRFARWSAFIPTSRRQATEIFRQALFYGFLSKHPPKVLGHNMLAASAYLVLWALLLVETITGFALDGLLGSEPGSSAFWWLRELLGPQLLRLIHHLCMWLILAISLFHIYSSVLVDHIEKNGLVASIFSGYKFVTAEDIGEARDGGEAVTELDEPRGHDG